jgi:predicted transposase/invertase (TIGR01784 family)
MLDRRAEFQYIDLLMETDSFFYQLLKQLPETLFALLGEPLTRVADYRFDALEVKKSYRLDGLFVPARADLPVYFVEVQFQRARRFYANLFAKVFSYLEANDPEQEWMAVALFPNRAAEPKRQEPYDDLLASRRVRRIYLDELKTSGGAPPGLTILQMATSAQNETPELVSRLLRRARQEPDCERADVIVELMEEVLIRRYHELDRVEIRRMFKLHDIRKTRVWQEAHEEGIKIGIEEGIEKGIEKGRALEKRQLVERLQANGQTLKEIAHLLGTSVAEVRRLVGR